MTQLQCVNCGSALMPDDIFCGVCGTAVRAADRGGPSRPAATSGAARTRTSALAPPVSVAREPVGGTAWWQLGPEVPSYRFFDHAVAKPAGPLSNSTRYLCAAAYLNPTYANTVISELVASRRAVAPSLDIDIIPVIRHCLNARKARLLRDVLLSGLVIAGLFLATVPVIAIGVVSFCLSFLPGVQSERRPLGIRVLAGLGIAVVVAAIVIYSLLSSHISSALSSGPLTTDFTTLVIVLVFLFLIGTVLVGYSYSMHRTFSNRLRPGASAGRFGRSSEVVEARIAQVAAAQQGNLIIYGAGDPFIGTGRRLLDEGWSIAIELDRASGPSKSGSGSARKSGSYVPIDPVELQQVIRARLLKVKDDGLPENERIAALSVHDHIAGDGHCRWDSPVIDQARTTPYSQASPEAIDALIRHPAAGLRYYQRVSVSDEGQPVWTRRLEVIGSTDQEIAVSAFIYVAVEGRMLYLQFVPTVLPPVDQQYRIVDRLPRVSSREFMVKVITHVACTSFRDMVLAPFGAIGTTLRMLAERRAYRSELKSASHYSWADVGARISVREFGGSAGADNFTHVLDTVKYTRIVQRLVLDTVLDFLAGKGVDTSAYQESASAILTNSYTIHGDVAAMSTRTSGRAEGRGQGPSAAHAQGMPQGIRRSGLHWADVLSSGRTGNQPAESWKPATDDVPTGRADSGTRLAPAAETSGSAAGGNRGLRDNGEEETRKPYGPPGKGRPPRPLGGGGPPAPPGKAPDSGSGGSGPRPRFLKGQCPQTIPVGKPFSLLASIVLTPGPTSARTKPFDVPPGGRDVLLVAYAPGLRLLSDQRQRVHVPADADSEPVMFELRADSPGPRSVSLTAWLGGNYLGELVVEITAERDAPAGPHREVRRRDDDRGHRGRGEPGGALRQDPECLPVRVPR